MKKIGLVTFFRNYNYGSLLQCYAMQSILEDLDFEVKVLNQVESGIYWKIRMLVKKISFLLSCIVYPKRIEKFYKFSKESERSCAELSINVKEAFEQFINLNINQENVSFTQMKRDNSFFMFICGSDQVWSLTAPFLNPFMFLKFANDNKRVSYAASTGTDVIPPWYNRQLKYFLKGFRSVSVRESSVIESFKTINCDNIEHHIDPTLIKNDKFWISKSTNCPAIKPGDYIVLFFLNKPSKIAIEHINYLNKDRGYNIYAFPYKFDKYSFISDKINHIDVRPEEFVRVLNGAIFICTDSFHGVAFSINLRKEFFVYNREYSAGTGQNTRIECILKRYNLMSRLIIEYSQNPSLNVDYSSDLDADRNKAETYLKTVLLC